LNKNRVRKNKAVIFFKSVLYKKYKLLQYCNFNKKNRINQQNFMVNGQWAISYEQSAMSNQQLALGNQQ
jgi:hypothetical protein